MIETWKTSYLRELDQAEAARRVGNEGRARVNARRAAGILAAEYFRRQGMRPPRSSAYDLLQQLASLESLDPAVREVSEHFLVQVTHEHRLPVEADLIAEARWLADHLLDGGMEESPDERG